MENTKEEKAMKWKFNFNLLSEEDREILFRTYHGDNWFETAAAEDIHIEDVHFFAELNALIANGLIKTDISVFENVETNEKRSTLEVFTHNSLQLSDDFVEFYFCRGDGTSDAENLDANTNTKIHTLLLKYRFW